LSPDEIIELLRQHALELIEFHDKMSVFENLTPTESLVVLNLCLYLIEELAENRWLTSDIIEKYEAGEPPKFVFRLQKNLDYYPKENLDQPPFDLDYFLNHPDL
jgi:hypothetical protein